MRVRPPPNLHRKENYWSGALKKALSVLARKALGLYKIFMRCLKDFYWAYRVYKLIYAEPKRNIGGAKSTKVKESSYFDDDDDDD
jgi:prephenate dehydratase